MHIETDELVVRDFQRKDAESLYRIVREKEIVRYMKDWSEHAGKPEDYYEYIDWLQTKAESKDVRENKRYAVALKATDELIGMVGMGLEDTVNEVEVAYFMSEQYQCKRQVLSGRERIYQSCCYSANQLVFSGFRYTVSDPDN